MSLTLAVLAGLCIIVVIIIVFLVRIRLEGERLYRQYSAFGSEVIKGKFNVIPHRVKPEYRRLHPVKLLKLFKIVCDSHAGEKLAPNDALNATIMGLIKMYTLLIRPAYCYNLPILSVDVIFVGQKRVFIIELIDPLKDDDGGKQDYYEQMTGWSADLDGFEPAGTESEWSKTYLADISLHLKADRKADALLFKVFKSYLEGYLTMAHRAQPLDDEATAKIRAGMENYVNTLLAEGGPAVDVFKTMLGPEGQATYVREVMFGLD